MEHKLTRGALRVDSRGDDAHHCDSPAMAVTLSVLLGPSPLGPMARVYKGSGNPSGDRSYHGLDTSSQAPSPQ